MADNAPQGFPTTNQPIASAAGIITRPWLQLLIALWNRTGAATGGAIVPSGVVVDFAGPENNIPVGWLACGQTVSRTLYGPLFTAIGTTWGAGDGSTTFDLPPQNIFSKGLGGDSVGDTGGAATVAISVAQLPSHLHAITDPGHTHAITDPGHHHTALTATSLGTTGTDPGTSTAGNTGDATTGITITAAETGITQTNDTGAGDPVSILPPYGTFLKIIKT